MCHLFSKILICGNKCAAPLQETLQIRLDFSMEVFLQSLNDGDGGRKLNQNMRGKGEQEGQRFLSSNREDSR